MSINQCIRSSPQSDNLRFELLEDDLWAFEVRVHALHCFQILLEVIRARGTDEIIFYHNQYLELLEQSEFEVVRPPKPAICVIIKHW